MNDIYKVEVFNKILSKEELEIFLNKMAQKGYELVQTNFAKYHGYQLIFKKVDKNGVIKKNNKTIHNI